jgi:transcription antitermination factor NusG
LKNGWYILLVRQGFENSIKEQLEHFSKELKIDEILVSDELTGYIFIRTIEISSERIAKIQNLDGFLRFLGTKKVEGFYIPQLFGSRAINKLNKQPKPQEKKFKLGDLVVIKQGDLSDIQGEIVEIKKRIVKIKPEFFHKIVRVKIQDIEFL